MVKLSYSVTLSRSVCFSSKSDEYKKLVHQRSCYLLAASQLQPQNTHEAVCVSPFKAQHRATLFVHISLVNYQVTSQKVIHSKKENPVLQ